MPDSVSRRQFLPRLTAGVSASLCFPADLVAQEGACGSLVGSRVRWIVPSAPGGGYDAYSRLLAPHLERSLGVRIQIDNVPGASGLLGSRALHVAKPNGLTLGILNLPSLLMASLSDSLAPNPTTDFTLLGRVARSRHVWVTGPSSGFTSIEDVLEEGRTRSIVFGINSIRGLTFFAIAVACSLLGLQADFVAGYNGSRAASLAAIRGEVDLVAFSYDALLDRILAADLRPLLQISDDPTVEHAVLEGLPVLSGPDGWAVRHASQTGRTGATAEQEAAALTRFMGAGRVIAAPPALGQDLNKCLAAGVCETLNSSGLAEVAASNGRPIDAACAEGTLKDVLAARVDAKRLLPITQEAIRRARSSGL